MEIHKDHKLVCITDTKVLEKEDISIEASVEEYEEIVPKTKELNDTLKKQINDIDILLEKTTTIITNSFKKKQDKLKEEETKLKEDLGDRVTKVKIKLEDYLESIDKELKIYDTILKRLKSLDKNQKDIFKKLTYISKIDKNKKGMKKLIREVMSRIKFTYIEKDRSINIISFCFNGLPIPIIEIKNETKTSIITSWKVEDTQLEHIKIKNKLKYKLEIKRENEKFERVCEGSNTEFNVKSLKMFFNYGFGVCTVFNGVAGFWSKVIKVQTEGSGSIILSKSGREREFYNKILEWTDCKELDLLYRGSRDGMTANSFHNLCDNKGPTITIYKNDKNNIFGGYAPSSWVSKDDHHSVPGAFIFTLTNIHDIQPTKFKNSLRPDCSFYDHSDYGPSFGGGCDVGSHGNFMEGDGGNHANFPHSYKDTTYKGNSLFTGNLDTNNNSVIYKEIEVFKINK